MNKKTNDTRAAAGSIETHRELFKPHLGLSRPRLSCFLMLALAVVAQLTVSLVWLSQHPGTAAKDSSVYRRFHP